MIICTPDPLNLGKFLEFVTDDIITFDYHCLYCKAALQNNEKICTQCGAPREKSQEYKELYGNPISCHWGSELLKNLPYVLYDGYIIEGKNFKRLALRCPECNTMLKPIEHGECIRCKCDLEIASYGAALILLSYDKWAKTKDENRNRRKQNNKPIWFR